MTADKLGTQQVVFELAHVSAISYPGVVAKGEPDDFQAAARPITTLENIVCNRCRQLLDSLLSCSER